MGSTLNNLGHVLYLEQDLPGAHRYLDQRPQISQAALGPVIPRSPAPSTTSAKRSIAKGTLSAPAMPTNERWQSRRPLLPLAPTTLVECRR